MNFEIILKKLVSILSEYIFENSYTGLINFRYAVFCDHSYSHLLHHSGIVFHILSCCELEVESGDLHSTQMYFNQRSQGTLHCFRHLL